MKRRRSRSRSRSDGGDRLKAALRTQGERLVDKVKDIEKGKKQNSAENEKHYQMEVRQIVVDDYWMVLEDYFRGKKKVPVKMKAVAKRGKDKLMNS